MTRKQLLREVKEQLKIWAKEIRTLKRSRKQDKRNGRVLWEIEYDIQSLKWSFRHHHIAYCEIRGRSREEIECPREGNPASQDKIDQLKEKWDNKIDEDVCVDTTGSN